ncbi:hypothetical protein F2Q69_00063704 [Brassica cretica]|uniref:Uncharacterized protein n=1 Tax=Brassica cretica TaxID=69181 RepID=A0A8S9RB36_BRACR|nr:hypothetical protein F2Q69_00063704 [Brassica cretica]
MGMKIATTSTLHQCVAHHSSSLSQTLSSSTVSSLSKRRSIGNNGRSLSCELWESSRHTKTHLLPRAFITSVDPFSGEEFSKKMQELSLKFQVSNEEDSDIFGSHDFTVMDTMKPPWHETVQMSTIERKANSVDLPLSLRIIKRKLKMEEEEEVIKQVGESSAMNRAFSSMVFMIRELQSFTLHMRELLLFEDLQGVLLRVRKEMHASFVWLFQQVFSTTPTLMVSVMILLANFTVYSIGTNSTLAAVSLSFDTTETNAGLDKGTDGDGSDKFRMLPQFSTSDSDVSVSGQEEIKLWNSIWEESEKMETLDHETMKQMVSPVEARVEAEESMDYFKTELLYQTGLSQQPDNVLLLTNYAQFLYLIIHDYDRAEKYFKRAAKAEPTDAEALNKYATFLWKARNDIGRAEETFLEAISADPTNSFYSANYAHFLWNTGGDETCFPLDAPP